ncbi:hypothetical protein [Nakamurella sp.]|uniref:hypothetical protein n=1 Tax=Nakamurella sp. TaxID=1869182 RepID=UPI003B3BC0F4
MTDLTPAEARKHLATLMTALARDIDNSTLRGHFHNRGYPHLTEADLIALRREIRDAVVAVDWPNPPHHYVEHPDHAGRCASLARRGSGVCWHPAAHPDHDIPA